MGAKALLLPPIFSKQTMTNDEKWLEFCKEQRKEAVRIVLNDIKDEIATMTKYESSDGQELVMVVDVFEYINKILEQTKEI